jgi:hypothetical protein
MSKKPKESKFTNNRISQVMRCEWECKMGQPLQALAVTDKGSHRLQYAPTLTFLTTY